MPACRAGALTALMGFTLRSVVPARGRRGLHGAGRHEPLCAFPRRRSHLPFSEASYRQSFSLPGRSPKSESVTHPSLRPAFSCTPTGALRHYHAASLLMRDSFLLADRPRTLRRGSWGSLSRGQSVRLDALHGPHVISRAPHASNCADTALGFASCRFPGHRPVYGRRARPPDRTRCIPHVISPWPSLPTPIRSWVFRDQSDRKCFDERCANTASETSLPSRALQRIQGLMPGRSSWLQRH
jgi:hypothetical protein